MNEGKENDLTLQSSKSRKANGEVEDLDPKIELKQLPKLPMLNGKTIDNDFKIIDGESSPSTSEAIPNVGKHLLDDVSLLAINIKVTESMEVLSFESLCMLQQQVESSRSFLIIFERQKEEKMIYWKLGGKQQIFELRLAVNEEAAKFIIEFVGGSIKNGSCGLLTTFACDARSICITIELFSIGDHRNFNLLLLASESASPNVVDFFIRFGFDIHVTVDGITAADLAYHNKNFEALLKLLQANSLFPSDFDESTVESSDELLAFVDLSQRMHESIESNDQENVKEILTENPKLRHFYNTQNHSAITCALANSRFIIFEILTMFKIFFGPKEDYDGLMDELSEKAKRKIKRIHERHSQSLMEKHLVILLANSSLGHDGINDQQKLTCVSRAYKILNSFPLISIILKIVAATRNFKITFDFNRDDVRVLDPNAEPYTNGLFYESGRISVAAKYLLDPEKEHIVFGVLAHEMSHFAMFIVYKNKARPYFSEDLQSAQAFEEIWAECERRKEKELVIDLVYEYPENMQHAELIVRIPDMIARYHQNEEFLSNLFIVYGSLFNFYKEKVMKTLEAALPEIEGESEKDIKGKYLKAERKLSKIRWTFTSVILVILFVFPFLIFLIQPAIYLWNDLNLVQQWFIKDHVVKFSNVNATFKEVFPLDKLPNLTFDELTKVLERSKDLTDIVKESSLNWRNMSNNIEHKFLNAEILFQNEGVKVVDLLPPDRSRALFEFSECQVGTLLKGETFEIGESLKDDSKIFPRHLVEYDAANVFVKDEENLNEENSGDPVDDSDDSSNEDDDEDDDDEASEEDERRKRQISQELSESNERREDIHQIDPENLIFDQDMSPIILVDYPDTGKTELMKHLARLFKENFKDYWIMSINLEENTKLTEKLGTSKGLSTCDLLANFLNLEINAGNKTECESKPSEKGQGNNLNSKKMEDKNDPVDHKENDESLNQEENDGEIGLTVEDSDQPSINSPMSDEKENEEDSQDQNDQQNDDMILKSTLNSAVFLDLCKDNRVIFLWDGHDHVPNHSQFVDLFAKIHESSNTQIISTRPEYLNNLTSELGSNNIYSIKPFDKKTRKEFIKYALGLHEESLHDKLDDFFAKVEGSNDKDRQINRPTMIKVFAETASKSDSDFDNLYFTFKTYIDHQFSSPTCQEMMKSRVATITIYRMHQIFAIEKLSNAKNLGLEILKDEANVVDDLGAIGLVTKIENSHRFINRAVQDFFSAQYFVDNLYSYTQKSGSKVETSNRVQVFIEVMKEKSFVRDLLIDFLKENAWKNKQGDFEDIVATIFANFSQILKEPKEEMDEISFEVIRTFFEKDFKIIKHLLINSGSHENIFDWLKVNFNINHDANQLGNILMQMWRQERLKKSSLRHFIWRYAEKNADEMRRSKYFVENVENLAEKSFADLYKEDLANILTHGEQQEMFFNNFVPIFFDELNATDIPDFWKIFIKFDRSRIPEILKSAMNSNKENVLDLILSTCAEWFIKDALSNVRGFLSECIIQNLLNNVSKMDLKPNSENCKNKEVHRIFYKFRLQNFYQESNREVRECNVEMSTTEKVESLTQMMSEMSKMVVE